MSNFERVKAEIAVLVEGDTDSQEYAEGLRWDPTPVVLSYGERSIELFRCDEPLGYPGYTGYHGYVDSPDGEQWLSGEWGEVSRDALEYLRTGELPEPSGMIPAYFERGEVL